MCESDPCFEKYVDVADNKKKITFTKHIEMNGFILEVTCFSQTDDTIVFIESNVTEKVRVVEGLQNAYKTIADQNAMILSSIDYASKIQRNLLPKEQVFRQTFPDDSLLWLPRDIVGGDIYWLKNFDEGSLLCVCDCTGHGTPGAWLFQARICLFLSVTAGRSKS